MNVRQTAPQVGELASQIWYTLVDEVQTLITQVAASSV